MIVDRNENTTIITQEKLSVIELIKNIENNYKDYKNGHLIISLMSLGKVPEQDIIEFLMLSNTHRGAKKSFVIVSNKVNLSTVPDEIIVVPTMQEAYDIIEMEDIERDLEL